MAEAVAYPKNADELLNTIDSLTEYGVPYFLAGALSNVLFKSHVYNGVVVKTTKMRDKIVADGEISAFCGARISEVTRLMTSLEYGGMEGLAGIPGTVGGMVKQNAGAYGYEISDLFKRAICYSPKERRLIKFSKEDMVFSYRKSALSDTDTVLISATFELVAKPKNDILRELSRLRAKRLESQPISEPSLGSVFKRYKGTGAGYYVDKCGLKGYSIGGARVSDKHAGFIVNTGNATADDYLRLIEYVKTRVYAEFAIELEEEIEII